MISSQRDEGDISIEARTPVADFQEDATIPVYDKNNAPLLAGAPAERVNPLGQEVTMLSAVMLNLGRILGSGIFSVPSVILNSVGSIGVLLLFWIVTPLFPIAGTILYTEYASMFPHRSGAEVAYMEQAYPKPRFLVPGTFAVVTILSSSSVTNATVFAQYFLAAFDLPVTPRSQSVVSISVLIVAIGIVGLSTKWSLRAVNFLTSIKVLSLVFTVCAGVAVFSGLTRIEEPFRKFERPFEGTNFNLNALAMGFIKTYHSFVGWNNSFIVLGEIRHRDPVRIARSASLISILLAALLFLFVNVSYIAVVPRDEILNSGQLIAVLFFRGVFGSRGRMFFPLMVASSCFGNIIAVTVGQARSIREVARQGLLPYPGFFSSTRPFKTPLAPVLLRGFMSILMVFMVPAQDAFNFFVNLANYPNMVMQSGLAIGMWVLRARRRRESVPPPKFRAGNYAIWFYLIISIIMVTLPWVPPEPGHSDVSFWYATYCAAGLSLILGCVLFYWVWMVLLPKFGGYEIVQEFDTSPDGARNARFVKRYKDTSAEHQPLLS